MRLSTILLCVGGIAWCGINPPANVSAADVFSEYSGPPGFQPTEIQKKWAIATTAIPSEADGIGIRGLSVDSNFAAWKLERIWGVSNRRSLLRQLQWLENTGYRADFDERLNLLNIMTPSEQKTIADGIGDPSNRYIATWKDIIAGKSLKGLDGVQYILLSRWGKSAGYIDDEEAWRLIMPAARFLQHTFSSWQAAGHNYVMGLEYWNAWRREPASAAQVDWTYLNLLMSSKSPWRTLPWNLDLGDAANVSVENPDDTAGYLRLFPHPAGLTCFSLTLFKEIDTHEFQPALSSMLGCPVRFANVSHADGNTEFAGDCIRPHAAQHDWKIRETFRLDALFEPLRREHVTQLFLEVSNPVTGTEWVNLPRHWRSHGFDYYFGLRDLRIQVPPVLVASGYSDHEAKARATLVALLVAFGIACPFLAKRRRHISAGTPTYRTWLQMRFGLWFTWTIAIAYADGLSFVRLFEADEGSLAGYLAALSLWLFGSGLDIALTILFRFRLKRDLGWNASVMHLLFRVARENLCILPGFVFFLIAADPQYPFTFVRLLGAIILLGSCHLLVWKLAHRIPRTWLVTEEVDANTSRLSAIAASLGGAISFHLIRRGEPVLASVAAYSNKAILVSEETLASLPDDMIAILARRCSIERRQIMRVARIGSFAVLVIGLFMLLATPADANLLRQSVLLFALYIACCLHIWGHWRVVLRADLDTAIVTGEPRLLISAILRECVIRRGTEGSGYEKLTVSRVKRLADAYEIDLGADSMRTEIKPLHAPGEIIHV